MIGMPFAFASIPGGLEWVVIGLVALLLFGRRLPGVARAIGQSMHEFKRGINGHADSGNDKAKEI